MTTRRQLLALAAASVALPAVASLPSCAPPAPAAAPANAILSFDIPAECFERVGVHICAMVSGGLDSLTTVLTTPSGVHIASYTIPTTRGTALLLKEGKGYLIDMDAESAAPLTRAAQSSTSTEDFSFSGFTA